MNNDNYFSNGVLRDYYDVLQVHRNADREIIEKAYKTLVKKYHPDHNLESQSTATEKMVQINEAYNVLKDPIKRADYNKLYDDTNKQTTTTKPLNTYESKSKVSPYKKKSTTKYVLMGITALILVLILIFVFYKISYNANYKSYTEDPSDTNQPNTNSTNEEISPKPDEISEVDQLTDASDKTDIPDDPLKDWKSKNYLAFSTGYEDFSKDFTDEQQLVGLIKTDEIIAHKGPSENFEPVFTIIKENPFYVFGSLDGWYDIYIASNNYGYGYVDSQYVDLYWHNAKDGTLIPVTTTDEDNLDRDEPNESEDDFDEEFEELSDEQYDYFGLHSSTEEVKLIMGDPLSIDNNLNLQVWHYSDATVTFDDNKVIGWQNASGELMVSLGEIKDPSQPISLGSTINEVVSTMGTPSIIEVVNNGSIWYYGQSSLTFRHGEVIGWHNTSQTINIIQGKINENAKPFSRGSNMKDVWHVMGTPDIIENQPNSILWFYDKSSIIFKNERVVQWQNTSNNLIYE